MLGVQARNNAVSYFLCGEAVGFDRDLVKRFADGLEVRLQIIVPPSHADLVPWLIQGKGDVIAAPYTVTPERARQVAFTAPYLEVQELLVQRASEPPLRTVADLRGRRIRVRAGCCGGRRTTPARGTDTCAGRSRCGTYRRSRPATRTT